MNFRDGMSRSRRAESTLELTPLIDVVFLLLIFFLITTTFANQQDEANIPIDLPEAVSGEAAATTEKFVLAVTPEGDVILNDEERWAGDDLRAKLEDLHAHKPDANIQLRGAADATHGDVTEILDLLKQVGFTRVNLVIRKTQ